MSITFPDPGMHGADVAHWQRFLQSEGLYRSGISGEFDSATQDASREFQREHKLHEKEPVDDVVFEAARALGYEIPQPNPVGEYFERKGRIELSSSDYTIIGQLAYFFYLWTDERITLTSTTRTVEAQATDMYSNWYNHRNERFGYKDHEAEREIRHAYENSIRAHKGESATVDAMTSVIQDQVRRGRFISLHLTGKAVDVRTYNMSADDQDLFISLGKRIRGVEQVKPEDDHIHIQFQ